MKTQSEYNEIKSSRFVKRKARNLTYNQAPIETLNEYGISLVAPVHSIKQNKKLQIKLLERCTVYFEK